MSAGSRTEVSGLVALVSIGAPLVVASAERLHVDDFTGRMTRMTTPVESRRHRSTTG
jgi:hypothetical protein